MTAELTPAWQQFAAFAKPATCLQVYLPLSYLYGMRATGELTPLVMSLREELYTKDYSKIDWNAARNQCAKEDLYYPHPWYQVRHILHHTVPLNRLIAPSICDILSCQLHNLHQCQVCILDHSLKRLYYVMYKE